MYRVVEGVACSPATVPAGLVHHTDWLYWNLNRSLDAPRTGRPRRAITRAIVAAEEADAPVDAQTGAPEDVNEDFVTPRRDVGWAEWQRRVSASRRRLRRALEFSSASEDDEEQLADSEDAVVDENSDVDLSEYLSDVLGSADRAVPNAPSTPVVKWMATAMPGPLATPRLGSRAVWSPAGTTRYTDETQDWDSRLEQEQQRGRAILQSWTPRRSARSPSPAHQQNVLEPSPTRRPRRQPRRMPSSSRQGWMEPTASASTRYHHAPRRRLPARSDSLAHSEYSANYRVPPPPTESQPAQEEQPNTQEQDDMPSHGNVPLDATVFQPISEAGNAYRNPHVGAREPLPANDEALPSTGESAAEQDAAESVRPALDVGDDDWTPQSETSDRYRDPTAFCTRPTQADHRGTIATILKPTSGLKRWRPVNIL
ncbi:Uncharacterized protein PBTT_05149 [Plasmodiophora brassicae]